MAFAGIERFRCAFSAPCGMSQGLAMGPKSTFGIFLRGVESSAWSLEGSTHAGSRITHVAVFIRFLPADEP